MVSHRINFIHLSDIHFDSRDADHLELNSDIRGQLQNDIRSVRSQLSAVDGILIGGDIAFAGQKDEYERAAEWLKTICGLAGCSEEAVWCVPGNHDVDRTHYIKSQTVKDHHTNLRPAHPDEVDKRITTYLRDELAVSSFFKKIEHYNDFAARFSCQSLPDPLAWSHDFTLNDGSTLRLFGLNSTLASDPTDDMGTRRLVLGTKQSRPPEVYGVTNLVMCHHPPDWLIDGDAAHAGLNARAPVQLFGHKHAQRLEVINNSLRIASGAVHPSRDEAGWIPRYNWLSVHVEMRGATRMLAVTVYPRVWSDQHAKFKPDYDSCDGADHVDFLLSLPAWTAEDLTATVNPVSVSSAVAAHGDQVLTSELTEERVPSSVEGDGSQADAVRVLVYRYLELPHTTRLKIAQDLELYQDTDEGLRDFELFERVFQRSAAAGKQAILWNAIATKYQGAMGPNPFDDQQGEER